MINVLRAPRIAFKAFVEREHILPIDLIEDHIIKKCSLLL